jgi:hypothetical protein
VEAQERFGLVVQRQPLVDHVAPAQPPRQAVRRAVDQTQLAREVRLGVDEQLGALHGSARARDVPRYEPVCRPAADLHAPRDAEPSLRLELLHAPARVEGVEARRRPPPPDRHRNGRRGQPEPSRANLPGVRHDMKPPPSWSFYAAERIRTSTGVSPPPPEDGVSSVPPQPRESKRSA